MLQSKLGAKVYPDLKQNAMRYRMRHRVRAPAPHQCCPCSRMPSSTSTRTSRISPINSFSTERPPHPEKITPAELEQMNSKIGEAITLLRKKVADQVKSDSVQACIAANFPPDAVTGATDTILRIVERLQLMKAAAHGGFPADFTLPSNQPALQR
jgi:hypothetical protein